MFHPSVYQGRKNPAGYFEGWYFKLVNREEDQVWSIIPGVSYSEDPHSFIQVIEALNGTTHYIRFPLESFAFSKDRFEVNIGKNHFSENGIKLDLKGQNIHLEGTIEFRETAPFPQKLLAPGIMGWYSFVPRMECYHGVVSMNHHLVGALQISDTHVLFTGGKGYIEKDWGTSMPSDWIWMQSNHFKENEESSFMLSIARIPWGKSYFPGFLSFFYHEGRVIRFSTYNRSKVDTISLTESEVRIGLLNRRYRLNIIAARNKAGKLKAPRHGSMDRDIYESLNAALEIELLEKNGKVLFSSRAKHAGLEIVGDVTHYF